MGIKFIKTERDDLKDYFGKYLKSISSPIDSFLEEHILESDFSSVLLDGKVIGYIAIHQKVLLTQFFLVDEFKYLGQKVFAEIKIIPEMKNAFVPTCDEFFMSHAIELNSGIEPQAYFFQDHKVKGKEPEAMDLFDFRSANEKDILHINEKSDGFFDRLEERIESKEIYIGSHEGEPVSFGIIEDSRIYNQYASIGMFVIEERRQQGFGVKTLLSLKQCCYDMDKTPIAGYWYHNNNSKKTIEKAGMYSKTRLLNVQL